MNENKQRLWEQEISRSIEVGEGYEEFEQVITKYFKSIVKSNIALFTTDVENLWDLYLSNISKDRQQHYNCNSCRHFIERYGNLVTVASNGEIKSLLWDVEVPKFFSKSVIEMNKAVMKSNISGVFISDEKTLGTPKTGVWSHLHVVLPDDKVNKSRLQTAYQLMAEKKQNYQMISRALQEFSFDTVTKAVQLLNTETLYRSDNCLGVAKRFKELHELLNETSNTKIKTNFKWLYVATSPNGFCHIKSSMIGTLLEDIQDGLSSDRVASRFAEKMSPSNYMRSQVAPTVGNIEQAEKVVARLGIANSLSRRYANIDEIKEFIWKNKKHTDCSSALKTSIFGHLATKNNQTLNSENYDLPSTTMTWDKFQRTVLPDVDKMEVKVENPNRLMAIVTASDSESENILQWNNPFSWYYHGGIDGEIKKRVEEAGGRYENNEIRCSLIWENYTDLDLHCQLPNGQTIYYGRKRVGNGWLDVDMNVSPTTRTPVENIRFDENAPQGRYKFMVDNYTNREYQNPYKVELEVNGQIFTYTDNATIGSKRVVFEFDYYNGQVKMISNATSISSSNSWNIESNDFIKVNGITTSPNTWNDNNSSIGKHVFFLLDGCKDTTEGRGRGFFTEMLKPELREIRKTLDAYMASSVIENIENASACGVGFNKDSEWNLIVKVTSNNSVRLIKIDRWD